MKLMLRVDTEKDNPETLIHVIEDVFENSSTSNKKPNQSTLTDNSTPSSKKYFCNNPKCKKEITKAVVAYCLHPENKERFKGKVYCIKCQEAQ